MGESMKKFIAILLLIIANNAYAGEWATDTKSKCLIWCNSDCSKSTFEWSGSCVKGKATGEGTLLKITDGQQKWKYIGKVRDGKFDGKSILIFASGDKYVGDFRDGKFDGKGILTFASGDKYVGDFRDSKYNGKGVFTFANGKKKQGRYVNDQLVETSDDFKERIKKK
jgi:hypothetical protein